jgi:rhamnosyl/mannosyltransferase
MKIMHFGKFYPPFNGGMEIYLKDLAEQQAINHSVTALVHNHNFRTLSSDTKIETINCVNVIRKKTLKPILFTPIMLGVNQTVSQLIDENKADIIHISWPNPSALFLLFNKKAKLKPWVIQWQSDMVTKNSSVLLKIAYLFFKPFERSLLKQAQKIIVSTQQYLSHSKALQNFKSKCEIIPLGLKQSIIEVPKKEIKWANALWKNAQYKIFSVGRLTFYKNHQILIKTATLLPSSLFIITGTGDLEKPLKKSIQQKDINNIILTGSLSESKLTALMQTCDAFCLPSNDRAESYGMVLLEAINFHKTILVSNLNGSGMKWIASKTKHGHTFNPNDPKELAQLIEQNLSTSNSNCTENIPELSIEYCASSIDKLYHSLADDS